MRELTLRYDIDWCLCLGCGVSVPRGAVRCVLCRDRRAPPEETPAEKIRERIREKREEYADFVNHLRMRTREEDLHGAWDASVNAAEVSNYIDGLEFALKAVEGATPVICRRPLPYGGTCPRAIHPGDCES